MGTDPFDVLGMPARFDLEPAQVQRAYLERSRALHPDAAGGQADAEAQTAALNEARAALADPERRAGVLLARLGGPAKEADRSLPGGFLERMLEARERLEEARAAGDKRAIESWLAWAEEERRGHIASVGKRFAGLGERPAPAALGEIRRELNAWRYVERMIEQMEDDGPS